MKILKIEFENINSLKGFHQIDFGDEPFQTNSLFAITGPTGSGKSSILDVISLALFNHVPRLGKITKNEIQTKGAILTRNQKKSMARVTYQCTNGIYSSQWSIEVNRNGNLNDYDMELHDHQAGKLIDLKKSMVPGRNEELIGLNYDQFIKAVLLAQGEFAQFLKAKKDERGELLEKITGTGIYRQLGIRAFEKNREANREIQDQQNEIKIIQNDLLSEESLAVHRNELKQKSELCKTEEEEIEKLKKAIQLKQEIKAQVTAIEQQKNTERLALESMSRFDSDHGLPLKQHEKAQPEADRLREWHGLLKNREETNQQKERINRALETNLKEQENILEQASKLTGQNLQAEDILESISTFRDKVLRLQEERKEKLSSFSSKKEQILAELRGTAISFNEQDPDSSIELLHSEKGRSEKIISGIISELEIGDAPQIQELQQQTKTSIRQAREAANVVLGIENRSREIKNLEKELEKDSILLNELPGKIRDQKRHSESLALKLQNAEQKKELELMKASLEDLRRQLKDGEACPLCGSEHHPFAHGIVDKEAQLDKKISDLKTESQLALRQLHQLEADFSNLEKRQKTFKTELKSLQEEQERHTADFSQNFKEFKSIPSREKLEQLIEKLEKKQEGLMQFDKEKQKLDALKVAIPLAKELKEILAQGLLLKKELDKLYQGKNIQGDVQQISNSWIKLKQDQTNLTERASENKTQLESLKTGIRSIEKGLAVFIRESGFKDIKAAWQALMPEVEAARLRKDRQQIAKSIDDAATSIKLLTEQLKKLSELDTETPREQLEKNLSDKSAKLKSLGEDCKELERKFKNQQDRLQRMAALEKQIEEKEKQTRRWRLLNELIGDSKGKQFNDFAQDLSLSQLLKLANKRLRDLHDRYLIAKPDAEEDDGLVAIDEHMGGQRRSVKTLSGGETFILSLSMALALSDLASRNVEINSLFIDEGFGTLDPETLDQTLDTLEKLQAESSKTIGLISHVDSLKERISTQIRLNRNGQGYSSLEIS